MGEIGDSKFKMQNAKCKMQTVPDSDTWVNVAATFTRLLANVVFAFCILHFEF
jgi:hypothetical protein